MSRNTLNFVVDAIGLLLMLGLIGTGIIMFNVLPPGSRGGRGLVLWGLSRHEWGDVHFYLALGLIAMLILHVALHWTWTCMTIAAWFRGKDEAATRMSSAKRNVLGAAFFVVLVAAIGGFWLGARASVAAGASGDSHGHVSAIEVGERPSPSGRVATAQ